MCHHDLDVGKTNGHIVEQTGKRALEWRLVNEGRARVQ